MPRRAVVTGIAVVALAVPALAPPVADAARFGKRTLSQGSSGSDVRTLQRYLTRAGFRVRADGMYGRATTRAVRRFERNLELRVDGVFSRRDARALTSTLTPHVSGGATYVAPPRPPRRDQTVAGEKARLTADGFAIPPASAPPAVKAVIAAGNVIAKKPYKWGGGHGRWNDSGYDCSGSVSYALHGGGLLASSMPSGGFMNWQQAGRGKWITTRANGGHIYMIVAGLRFDTSAVRVAGSRWTTVMRSARGFSGRHPRGY
jgi:peptidoglycan hydrolase-like protein with peptidoglycan-binding domain